MIEEEVDGKVQPNTQAQRKSNSGNRPSERQLLQNKVMPKQSTDAPRIIVLGHESEELGHKGAEPVTKAVQRGPRDHPTRSGHTAVVGRAETFYIYIYIYTWRLSIQESSRNGGFDMIERTL